MEADAIPASQDVKPSPWWASGRAAARISGDEMMDGTFGPRRSSVGIFMIAATALALFATPSPAAISVASYATGRDSAEQCDPLRSGFKGTATQFVTIEKANPAKFRGCDFTVSFDEIISVVVPNQTKSGGSITRNRALRRPPLIGSPVEPSFRADVAWQRAP